MYKYIGDDDSQTCIGADKMGVTAYRRGWIPSPVVCASKRGFGEERIHD